MIQLALEVVTLDRPPAHIWYPNIPIAVHSASAGSATATTTSGHSSTTVHGGGKSDLDLRWGLIRLREDLQRVRRNGWWSFFTIFIFCGLFNFNFTHSFSSFFCNVPCVPCLLSKTVD